MKKLTPTFSSFESDRVIISWQRCRITAPTIYRLHKIHYWVRLKFYYPQGENQNSIKKEVRRRLHREDSLDGLLKLIDVIDVLCDGQIPKDEIPKFIVIAVSKFHFSEKEAWNMTPRKFSLLNEAYRVINGLKREEEDASLLSLP